MTALDENQAKLSEETNDELGSEAADFGSDGFDSETAGDEVPPSYAWVARRHARRVALLRKLRKLEKVYVAGMTALLAFGAVELPIALIVLGGHVLVKQHQSRSLSAIGEVMEDVFGHHVV
ncbi:MAG: hypothetical protein ABR885_19180 [Mycobacterium sp.]